MAIVEIGKNNSEENFALAASPQVSPNMRQRLKFGTSSQSVKAYKPLRQRLVTAISVVAKPACPNIDGIEVIKNKVKRAIISPNSLRLHIQVTKINSKKKGIFPNLASDKL